MSALTLRKKRSLADCITDSGLAPKPPRIHLENWADFSRTSWTVDGFATPFMESAHATVPIDQDELINKLQVFDSTLPPEKIRALLDANRGDFVSVMNILKEKASRRTRSSKNRSRLHLRGSLLKSRIIGRLENSRAERLSADASISKAHASSQAGSSSPEKYAKQPPIETRLEPGVEALVDRVMACKSAHDVQTIAHRIAWDFNQTLRKLERSQSENYILKMGICQRKHITDQEIRRRVQIQQQLADTRIELARLKRSQKRLQHSLREDWTGGDFDCEGY